MKYHLKDKNELCPISLREAVTLLKETGCGLKKRRYYLTEHQDVQLDAGLWLVVEKDAVAPVVTATPKKYGLNHQRQVLCSGCGSVFGTKSGSARHHCYTCKPRKLDKVAEPQHAPKRMPAGNSFFSALS